MLKNKRVTRLFVKQSLPVNNLFNYKSVNNLQQDELTPKERKDYDQMVELEYT